MDDWLSLSSVLWEVGVVFGVARDWELVGVARDWELVGVARDWELVFLVLGFGVRGFGVRLISSVINITK